MSMNVQKCGSAFLVLAAAAAASAHIWAGGPAIEKGLVVFVAFDGPTGSEIEAAGPHSVKVRADGCKFDAAKNGVILDGRTFVRIGLPEIIGRDCRVAP